MKTDKIQAKMVGANEAYQLYHVTRAWLREHRNSGSIRCSETHGRGFDGRSYVKYLYNVEDIERELQSFSTRSQARKTHLADSLGKGGEDRW